MIRAETATYLSIPERRETHELRITCSPDKRRTSVFRRLFPEPHITSSSPGDSLTVDLKAWRLLGRELRVKGWSCSLPCTEATRKTKRVTMGRGRGTRWGSGQSGKRRRLCMYELLQAHSQKGNMGKTISAHTTALDAEGGRRGTSS